MSKDNPSQSDPLLDPNLAPRVRAAAMMFRDISGRQPLTMIHPEPLTCPKCGDALYLETIQADWFPYMHVDYNQKCPSCLESYLYGLSMTRDLGLSLIVYDSNPVEATKHMWGQRTPFCAFGHSIMTNTKIFGDLLSNRKDKVTLQWKCPICFLTSHKTFDRDYPHGDNDPFTDSEKDIIEERLRHLGYIE